MGNLEIPQVGSHTPEQTHQPAYQESVQQAATKPSHDQTSKPWHVSDDQIEEMIRRLPGSQGLNSSQGNAKRRTSALRDKAASNGALWQHTVHFNDNHVQEDSLDQVLRESYRQPKGKHAWKVSDEALLEFVRNTKKALSSDVEDEATISDIFDKSATIRRTVFGSTGGYVMSSQPGVSSSNSAKHILDGTQFPCSSAQNIQDGTQLPAVRFPKQERVPRLGYGIAKSGSIHCRNYNAKHDLADRPAWVKTQSMPNLFPPVGSGLDGRGSKLVSASTNFEETPIFLSDAQNCCMERVRERVCGHPYYMPRR